MIWKITSLTQFSVIFILVSSEKLCSIWFPESVSFALYLHIKFILSYFLHLVWGLNWIDALLLAYWYQIVKMSFEEMPFPQLNCLWIVQKLTDHLCLKICRLYYYVSLVCLFNAIALLSWSLQSSGDLDSQGAYLIISGKTFFGCDN